MSVPIYTDPVHFSQLKEKYSIYNDSVFKDVKRNLIQRRQLYKKGYSDYEQAKKIYSMCSQDILFWCNCFVWTYNPKNLNCPELPFICYPFQEESLLNVLECIQVGQDIFTDKSRDMGASWIYLIAITWLWLFRHMASCLLLSRNEDYVDKSGNPKCLFWKIDYILKKMPKWMLPKYSRTKLHLLNEFNGSTIEGESTTSRSGRGDRKLVVLLDEFAAVDDGFKVLSATADVTDCRIFNSTYEGSGNAFFEVGRWGSVKKLRFHWSQHPEKGAGLYRIVNKKVEIIDQDYYKNLDLANFNFVQEHGYYNGLHSPWYDKQCNRRTVIEIKEQLDIDPHGSGAVFFDGELVDHLIDKDTVEPFDVGELFFEDGDYLIRPEFIKSQEGLLKLWFLTNNGLPMIEFDEVVLGVDISAGTGASNSVICGYDLTTGDKILEYVNSNLRPDDLAQYALAISRFLNMERKCFLIWEANGGGGRNFGKEITDSKYRNIYYKTNEESEYEKESDIPGWFSTKDKKKALLGTYRKMLKNNYIKNYSKRAVSELREYIFDNKGGVTHSKELRNEDPSGASDNHGDIVIADALCAKVYCEKNKLDKIKKKLDNEINVPSVIPENSIAGRALALEAENWDDGLKGW